jgi:hypothetical protein
MGSRRFLPMPISAPIDEEWLRRNREQLWAEAIELEGRGRHEYNANNPHVKRGEEKFPDIMLDDQEIQDELAELGRKHMKEGVKLSPSLDYEPKLRVLMDQPFVLRRSGKTFVIGDDVRNYLGVNIGLDRYGIHQSSKDT